MEKVSRPVRIFVPRWMDRSNTNAQNSNARALLSRFRDPRADWTAVYGEDPEDAVTRNGVKTVCISRSRWWPLRLALAYQSACDAIFYPGPEWSDDLGLRIRTLMGRKLPIISTIEGIIADERATEELSALAGHPVFSQAGVAHAVPRLRRIYRTSHHIIAISPFLARVAEFLYGQKVSCVSLGLETRIFHSHGRQEPERCRVVGCGTVKSSKNPQAFLRLAQRHEQADFVWYGNGPLVEPLAAETKSMGLANLSFPGALCPERLAEELRKSSIFVLPSLAEGAPKAAQEAAACGLPVVIYGFYEAPSVLHEVNGLVAWSEEELFQGVATLIAHADKRTSLGQRGAEMAKQWDWDLIAPQWEEALIRLAGS